jgi:serine/threonine protein kinase
MTSRPHPLPQGVPVGRGRYTIESVLGQGGYGYVYLARDQQGQSVAIKQCTDLSSEGLMQFGHELAVQKIVKHAVFVRVYAQFVEKVASINTQAPTESLFTVMEYVPGRSLEELLDERLQQNQGPFPEYHAIAWITQLLGALQHAHAVGVIHRDIKPANILLLPDGRSIKVIDFGIAKIGGTGAQTLHGARGISPGYSPPEQYSQSGQTDTYSDIYAVGATLYHLVTGHAPVDAPVRQSGQPLVLPRQHNPALSPMIETVILQAMQLNVADRFQNAVEMSAALQGKGLAVSVHSLSSLSELLSWCDKHWQDAIRILRSGELLAAIQYLGKPKRGHFRQRTAGLSSIILDQVRHASALPNDNLALETALRALGAKPPRFTHNWPEIERKLGMGWRPDPRWFWPWWSGPGQVTFVIQNRGRGYLHGRVDPAVPWLEVKQPEFGCLVGQKQRIQFTLKKRQRRLTGLAPEILVLQVDQSG